MEATVDKQRVLGVTLPFIASQESASDIDEIKQAVELFLGVCVPGEAE